MKPYTRSGEKVLNLRGAWADGTHHSLLTTTRDFFDEKSFRDIRAHLAEFKKAQPQAYALLSRAMQDKAPLSTENRKTLTASLQGHALEQDWKNSERGVLAVAGWVGKNGNAMPDALLDVEGRPILPDELAEDVRRFEAFQARNPEQGALAAAFLASGRDTPPEDRALRNALQQAGLLTRTDSLSLQGKAVAQSLGLSGKIK